MRSFFFLHDDCATYARLCARGHQPAGRSSARDRFKVSFRPRPSERWQKEWRGDIGAVREGEKMEHSLMVDSVSEVVEIAAMSIEPPPQFGTSIE